MSTALGNCEDSVALVRTGLCALPHGSGNLVRSELLGLESRALAQLRPGYAGDAERAAEACVQVYDEHAADPAPDWIHYMDRAEADCLAANTYIDLALSAGDGASRTRFAAKAEVHVLSARAARGDGYVRSRIFDQIRLAKVRLAQGEQAEAEEAGILAITMAHAARARSAQLVRWLDVLGRELPAAPVYREQLRELTAGPS
jgi:hypothetical protein